ncbi:c-type cytochrome [Pontibacter vulgaris]|uniref:c-type cytochrome n=1 Tax=Pontibacter vulgaris TaxID=2905679 RepID=UPI001FA6E23B|nr:c-type cytochrome [Pontibacter vulgaris]
MKKAFKIIGYIVVGIVLVIAAGVLYLRYTFPKVDAAPVLSVNKTAALEKRGEYLANHVAVCIDCHSSRDWSRFSGPLVPGTEGKGGDKFDQNMGFPGTFYAKNITSDKETGVGAWTDGELYRAITMGVSKNGEPLFPLMPYKAFNQMAEQDVHAIIAYIRTLAPVKNVVPKSEPDFPFSLILRTLPENRPLATAKDPELKDPVLKGKYLFTMASCAECHTPQDKDGPLEGMYLAGGVEFKFPNNAVVRSANLTPDKETGIGTWTEDTFVQRFKSRGNPEALAKVSPDGYNSVMPWSMYGGMEEEDLRAIYKYLRTVEPTKNKVIKFSPAPKATASKS